MSSQKFCDRCGLGIAKEGNWSKIALSWTWGQETRTIDLCKPCWEKVEPFLNKLWTDRVTPQVKEA